MRLTTLIAFAETALAFPGMKGLISELSRRQSVDSNQLLGDLVTLADSALTATGAEIASILSGGGNSEDLTSTYVLPPPALGSEACSQDTCCVWKYIADDMQSSMLGNAGRCNALARGCVRLGFHDAGTWSTNTGPGGGADGSIVLANECYDRSENDGLQSTCDQMKAWYAKYSQYGVTMADLIQMGATVATVTCPLGPRIRSYVGRPDSSEPAPTGLLPSPTDSADSLIALFAAKTFTPAGLVALVGAHTTSQQFFVDPARAGDPQDSTPGVWDVVFYGETTDPNAPQRVYKFQSDINLSEDSRTQPTWQQFSGATGQPGWNQAFATEYIRLSLLGVNNINDLTDCTKALPLPVGSFNPPDQSALNTFLNGPVNTTAADELLDGNSLLKRDLFGLSKRPQI